MDDLNEFLDRFPVVDENNLIEYDELMDKGEYKLGGRRNKRFYRASTALLGELFDELNNNPECSYITPFNDLIKNQNYIPKHMSVILKESFMDFSIREVLSSRIYNFFGVKTTYDMLVRKDDKLLVMSTDFVSEGEKVCNFYDDICVGIDCWLENDILHMTKEFTRIYNISKIVDDVISYEEFKEDLDNYIEDYVYQFLVKRYVVGEMDIYGWNECAIIDQKFHLKSCPVFDKEFAFGLDYNLYDSEMYENLKYVKIMYPQIYNKFQSKVHDMMSQKQGQSREYERIMRDNFPELQPHSKPYIDYVSRSLANIQKLCKKINNELLM